MFSDWLTRFFAGLEVRDREHRVTVLRRQISAAEHQIGERRAELAQEMDDLAQAKARLQEVGGGHA